MKCRDCRYGDLCCSRQGLPLIRVTAAGLVESCGFNALQVHAMAIAAALGTHAEVLSERSHTTRVAVEIRDPDALERAAGRLGWQYWRVKTVQFYDGLQATGAAVQPPLWHYPIVASAGELAYDNYFDAWGPEKDIARLKGAYTLEVARSVALARGLDVQEINGELIIYQAGGQSIQVRADGSIEAVGFSGSGCSDATRFVEEALGRVIDTDYKPEFYGGGGQQAQHYETSGS